MRRLILVLAVGGLITTSFAQAQETVSTDNDSSGSPVAVVSDQMVLEVAAQRVDDFSLGRIESLRRLNELYGVSEIEPLFPGEHRGRVGAERLRHYFKLTFDPQKGLLEDVLQAYQRDAAVETSEAIYIHRLYVTPNDPNFSSQWHLHQANDCDIDAPEAWDVAQGNDAVILAIIDTGILYTHADLTSHVWQNPDEIHGNGQDDDGNGYVDDVLGWDWVEVGAGWEGEDVSNADNDPRDFNGHGTHCAGIVSAVTDNGVGVAGVSWHSQLMALRVGWSDTLWEEGVPYEVGYVRMDYAAQAIVYAVDEGATVINSSWGSSNSGGLGGASDYAQTNGVLIVHAAGNDDENTADYLGDRPEVLTVAATGQTDLKASFSNFGDWVDVSAPGVDIASTYSSHYTADYAYMSGTSMAAPVVVGVAGLLKSLYSSWESDSLYTRIVSTSDNIDALNPGYEDMLGSGRVNAYKAVTGASYVMYVGGTLSEDATWHSDHVYMITSDLTVPLGVTLTIEAGTVVKLQNALSIHVWGILDVQGTSENPVAFTSWKDDSLGGDSNGDGGASSPGPGNWRYIRFLDSSSTLDYCLIKYGGGYYDGKYTAVYAHDSAPDIQHNTIRYCGGGIYYTYSGGSPVTISDNQIHTTTSWGIHFIGNMPSTLQIANNVIAAPMGILCSGSSAPQITGNDLTCSGGSGNGIQCSGCDNSSVISGNTISEFGYAIYTAMCSPSVTGNTMTHTSGGATRYAYYLNDSYPDFSGNTITGTIYPAIAVHGTWEGSITWGDIEGRGWPYVVVADLTIGSSGSLTLPAGTVVKLQNALSIHVWGILDVQGTSENPVAFTSWKDDSLGGDSNGDGGASSPGPGNWRYIRFLDSSNTLDYCLIKYGGGYYDGRYTVVYAHDSAPDIQHNTIRYCGGGIYYTYSGGSPVNISDNQIHTTTSWGIWFSGSEVYSSPQIRNNVVYGPGSSVAGLYCNGRNNSAAIDNNWVQDFNTYAIQVSNSDAELTNNTLIQTGTSVDRGIGIYLSHGCETVISGNTISKYDVAIKSESGSGNAPCDLDINFNRIINNGGIGLQFRSTSIGACDGPSAHIHDNDIYSNDSLNLYLGDYQNPETRIVNAENNWWGSSDSAEIAETILDHEDDPGSPTADFIPYRTCPIQPSDPDISVNPYRVDANLFPDSVTTRSLVIRNGGLAEALTFSIEEGVGGLIMAGNDSEADGLIKADLAWLDEEPTTGMISPGDSVIIQLTFNSLGLSDGIYVGYLIIDNNDLDADPLVVPVSLDVSHVFVLSPNGGEEFEAGQNELVTWNLIDSVSVDSVSAWYSIDGGESYPHLIASGVQGSSHIDWMVPNTPSDSCTVKIEVFYAYGLSSEDESDGLFTITELPYVPGDANGDEAVDLGDAVYVLNYLFKNGPAPDPFESGDANCDGKVDLGDVVYLLNYLFKGGPPPGC